MRPHAAIVAILLAVLASADTFTNKKTGETVAGKMLGTAFVDGGDRYLVRTESGARRQLPMDEWDHKIDTSGGAPADPAPPKPKGYQYQGRSVSKDWFERAYRRFCGDSAFVDGKLLPLTSDTAPDPGEPERLIRVGKGKTDYTATVSRVRGADAVIAFIRHNGTRRAESIHVTGLDAKLLGQGAPLPEGHLLLVGNHSWKPGPKKKRRTVRSFTVAGPLTREQFADVLGAGLKLYVDKPVYKDCARCKGIGQIFTKKRRLVAGMERLGHWEEYTVASTCPDCKGQKRLQIGTKKVEVTAS